MKKARYIIAVSGGVDSVVLLDKMSRLEDVQLMVAHFDHGIRPDSHEDALFVKGLAQLYGVPYESRRENLGSAASENLARQRRYAFLESLAQRHDAKIVTAHHLDDLIETVAINLTRGTGWRGLAVFHSAHVRPLLNETKDALIQYALQQKLEWREDSTNSGDAYLRNRIRKRAAVLDHDDKQEVKKLHSHQRELRQNLEREARRLIGGGPLYSRYIFTHMGDAAAIECLWAIFDGALTRPQLARVLHAIKTARSGAIFEAGVGKSVHFTTRHFSL